MKVKVKFVPIYSRRSFTLGIPSDETYSPIASLVGKGTVSLHETGIFLQGEMPKMRLGRLFRFAFTSNLFWFVYRNIISLQTVTTIPYLKVLKYKQPRSLGGIHIIIYKLPITSNGEEEIVTIRFKFSKINRQHEKDFPENLNGYLNAAKCYQQGNPF
jgi:hypothetical protein